MIDLRSDTVTKPSAGMLERMLSARVGDDVYGEDATVNELEERVAEMLGKERALFVPTGVMSNQLCLKALTRPGDEVIVGEESHIFNYETGAPALLSGIQLHTVPDPLGAMSVSAAEAAIRDDAYYLPRTSVIALELTHNRGGGTIADKERVDSLLELGQGRGIAMHLDGARLWNAAVATGRSVHELSEGFDTVSVCLSKGLGAPIGSVMAGSHAHVETARRFRKVWGGGWRQAGFLAAAGLYALDNNIDRLAEDHVKASRFAGILQSVDGVSLLAAPQTNIVIFSVEPIDPKLLADEVARRGVLVSAAFKGKLRAVFHLDVTLEDSERAAHDIGSVVAGLRESVS